MCIDVSCSQRSRRSYINKVHLLLMRPELISHLMPVLRLPPSNIQPPQLPSSLYLYKNNATSFPSLPPSLPPPPHNLRNSMPNRRARLLRLFFRQPTRDTNFKRWLRLPPRVARIDAQAEREGFEARYQDAVGEALRIQLSVCDYRWGFGKGMTFTSSTTSLRI